jgi:hypothetical protein
MHPPERPKSEGERGEQAVDEGQRKLVKVQGGITGSGSSLPNRPTMTNGSAAPAASPITEPIRRARSPASGRS